MFRIRACLTRWLKAYPTALTFHQRESYSIYVEGVVTYCLNEFDEVLSDKHKATTGVTSFVRSPLPEAKDDIFSSQTIDFHDLVHIGFSCCAYLLLTPCQWTTCQPHIIFSVILDVLLRLSDTYCCNKQGSSQFVHHCQSLLSSSFFILALQSSAPSYLHPQEATLPNEQKAHEIVRPEEVSYHAVSAYTMRQQYALQKQKALSGVWVSHGIQTKAMEPSIRWIYQLPPLTILDFDTLLSIWKSSCL